MAKGKGSLFSLNSQGRFGGALYFRNSAGVHVAQTLPVRRAAPTAAQLAARAHFLAACQAWHALPEEERAYWKSRSGEISTNGGFSEFLHEWKEEELVLNINDVVGRDLGYELPAVLSGDWGLYTLYSSAKKYLRNSTTPEVGDYFQYEQFLPAYTYQLEALSRKGGGHGIWEFLLDDVSLGTVDYRSASLIWEARLCFSDVVVASSGVHTVKVICVGKNPLATSYLGYFSDILFRRTS